MERTDELVEDEGPDVVKEPLNEIELPVIELVVVASLASGGARKPGALNGGSASALRMSGPNINRVINLGEIILESAVQRKASRVQSLGFLLHRVLVMV